MFFNVNEIIEGDRTILSAVGDIDLASMPQLANRISLARSDTLVVDLGSVDHFDPLCFGVLIAGGLSARRSGRRFAVLCPSGRTREVIDEVGLGRIVEIIDTVESLESLESRDQPWA